MSPLRPTAVLLLLAGLLPAEALAQTRRPTPREAITRSLAPFQEALTGLSLTEEERRGVEDLVQRSEAIAAERVEQNHRRDHDGTESRSRQVALLIRVLRGRVEALRAEARAEEAETAALAAEERRTLARSALERASERSLAVSRDDITSPRSLPRPEAPSNAPTSPTTGTSTPPATPPAGGAAAPAPTPPAPNAPPATPPATPPAQGEPR